VAGEQAPAIRLVRIGYRQHRPTALFDPPERPSDFWSPRVVTVRPTRSTYATGILRSVSRIERGVRVRGTREVPERGGASLAPLAGLVERAHHVISLHREPSLAPLGNASGARQGRMRPARGLHASSRPSTVPGCASRARALLVRTPVSQILGALAGNGIEFFDAVGLPVGIAHLPIEGQRFVSAILCIIVFTKHSRHTSQM